MRGRFPDNLILSHDLLEGCYARSGLVTDVQFYEEYPSGYLKDSSRRHRWIRGDWQILSWVFSFVRGPGGTRIRNPISFLSQWKIADNLRRSLVPGAAVFLFLSGWLLLPSCWLWSLLMIALLGFPLVPMTLMEAVRKPGEMTLRAHVRKVFSSVKKNAIRFFFSLVLLLHEAFICLDASGRTLWRMFVSGKRLIEWTTSLESQASLPNNILGCLRSMAVESVVALLLLVVLLVVSPGGNGLALIILGLWFAAPLVVLRN